MNFIVITSVRKAVGCAPRCDRVYRLRMMWLRVRKAVGCAPRCDLSWSTYGGFPGSGRLWGARLVVTEGVFVEDVRHKVRKAVGCAPRCDILCNFINSRICQEGCGVRASL